MLRTITRGATDAGRGIQRGVGIIGRGIVAFGRVSLDLLRTIVRSYNRGVFLAYIQTGGNVAVTLSTNIVTPYSFHVIELWTHRTISLAWFWGVLGSIVANSYRSFIDASSSIVNLVLTEEQQFRQTVRNRHFFFRVVLGSPGAVLGLIVGVVGLLGGIIYGTCVNSWISLFSISKRMTNLAMERKWEIDPDRRSLTFFVLGLPGTALGIVIGLVGFLGAGIARAASNSWISLQRVTRQVTNVALENKMILGPDNRSLVSKILGSPGMVIGGIFGAVGFVAAGIGRVIYNSLISMTRVFIQVTDLAFENRTPLDTDKRSLVSKILGASGIVVGVVIGGVGFLGVGIGRAVSNSWISLVQQAQRLINIALEEGRQITILEVQRSRASTRLGWPGLVLGMVIGSIGFLGAGIGRVAANSWISLVQQAQRLTNLALDEGKQIRILEVHRSRASTRLGWPGLVLGVVIGTIGFLGAGLGRIVSNSWVSLVLETQRVMNLAREHQMDVDRDLRPLLSIRLGALGVVVGFVIGGVGFVGVGIGRVASNSWISWVQQAKRMTNVARDERSQIRILEVQRSTVSIRLGAPGFVLGVAFGAIGFLGVGIARVIDNSWTSLVLETQRVINLAREHQMDADPDSRSLLSIRLGALGVVVGFVIGGVGFLGVGIGRAASNGWISLQRVTRQVTNVALENKMILGPDNRSLVSKILGSPGMVIGGMFGAVGLVAAGIGRVIYNSLISMTRVFIQVTDLAFENRTPLDTDKRSLVSKILGAPGIVVGFVIGGVGFLGVGIGRAVSNSWISLVQQAQRLINIALEEGRQITILEVQRSRASIRLGWPGLVLGMVIGSIGFLGAGIGRAVSNSWISLVQQAQRLINIALEEGHQITILEVHRSRASTRLGWPGLVLGVVIGTIGFLGAGLGRIVSNSWVSLVLETQRVMNLAREHQMDVDRDLRPLLSIRLGVLGVVVGVVIGGVGFLGVGIARAASNSWISLERVTRQVTNLALENKMIIGTDNRPFVSIILGSPGMIVGGILGAVGLVAAGIGRAIYNSLISMTRVIIQVTDLAFENKTTIIADQRPLVSIVLGSPGIFIGFWIGCAGFLGVAIGRVVYNSAKTYKDLSGSMMNVVLERAYFEGVRRENTAFKRWGLGLPGAVLSIISVGLPAGMIYLLLRKLIPLMFAIVAFPVVCLYRAVSELGKYFSGNQRFTNMGNVTEQIFKNFFASLTMMGNLPEGERLNRAGNGPFYIYGPRLVLQQINSDFLTNAGLDAVIYSVSS